MQRIDAMSNERHAHDRVDGPNYQSEEDVCCEILYEEERERRDREIEDGGCAQEDAAVGGVEGYCAGQQLADG